MNNTQQVNQTISLITEQLKIVDLIPTSFDPNQIATGIDRDILDELISDWEHKLTQSIDKLLSDLLSFQYTLSEYISLFTKEIKSVTLLEYTTPQSVNDIMDVIGTKGVLNSENGLNIYTDRQDFKLAKTNWLMIHGNAWFVIDKNEKATYDLFLKSVN